MRKMVVMDYARMDVLTSRTATRVRSLVGDALVGARAVVVTGAAGMGKTWVARQALAGMAPGTGVLHEGAPAQSVSDAVVALASDLRLPLDARDDAAALAAIGRALERRDVSLLALDGWDCAGASDALGALLDATTSVRFLVTRRAFLEPSPRHVMASLDVGKSTDEEASAMFLALSPSSSVDPQALAVLGGNAAAVVLAAHARDARAYLDRCARARASSALERALRVAYADLAEPERRALRLLACAPSGVTKTALERFGEPELEAHVETLARRGLVVKRPERQESTFGSARWTLATWASALAESELTAHRSEREMAEQGFAEVAEGYVEGFGERARVGCLSHELFNVLRAVATRPTFWLVRHTLDGLAGYGSFEDENEGRSFAPATTRLRLAEIAAGVAEGSGQRAEAAEIVAEQLRTLGRDEDAAAQLGAAARLRAHASRRAEANERAHQAALDGRFSDEDRSPAARCAG